jgi:hypothetical protein
LWVPSGAAAGGHKARPYDHFIASDETATFTAPVALVMMRSVLSS